MWYNFSILQHRFPIEKAAEVRTATGDRIAGSYHCRRNKWKDAQFSRRKDVECDRKDGLGEIKSKTMSQHAVIFLRHIIADRVKIGYTVSIELYINNLLRGWYKICLKNSR